MLNESTVTAAIRRAGGNLPLCWFVIQNNHSLRHSVCVCVCVCEGDAHLSEQVCVFAVTSELIWAFAVVADILDSTSLL